MSEWQPISTAPRGVPVLCYSPGNKKAHNENARPPHMKVDDTRRGGWWLQYPEAPYTHWQPLPAPPAQEAGDA